MITMWFKILFPLCLFCGSQSVFRSVIIDEIIDIDMEFYKANIGDEASHTMLMKLDGEGLYLENVTVKPYNNWKREISGDHDHALLSLDTRAKKYSFEYKISLNDFKAVFGLLKLPAWSEPKSDVIAHFDKAVFKFGPMSRIFLDNSMCNSTLSVTLIDAKVTIDGKDMSEIFRTVVARAFERKSKALCNIANPHKCLKIFTPLMYGHF